MAQTPVVVAVTIAAKLGTDPDTLFERAFASAVETAERDNMMVISFNLTNTIPNYATRTTRYVFSGDAIQR